MIAALVLTASSRRPGSTNPMNKIAAEDGGGSMQSKFKIFKDIHP
jgi:hypothetical protein